jgi:hypothetical protein
MLDGEPQGSSDRAFGLVFTAFFLVVALLPLAGGGSPRSWALAVAAAFLLCALARPGILAPLNRAWTRLGLLLNAVISPVALGILFYGVVTPTGWALRALGKDPLRLRREPQAATYWIERQPPGPEPDSLRNQF